MRLETINDIDNMDGHDFEYLCADVLRKNGYSNVSVTSASGDFGIDVLAEKDGEKYAIQCKRWNNRVTNKAVQEALSGKVYYGYDHAVVLTNNYFNDHAIETARRTGVILWDRNALISMIKNAYPNTITFSNRRSSSNRISPKPLAIAAAIILLIAIIPKNRTPASQKQKTDLGKSDISIFDKSSPTEKTPIYPASISAFDGTWELMVADEYFNIKYNAGWPQRIIDTKAGTVTINWPNNPVVYDYELLSSGKLAFSYYWAEYTTSFDEEIEVKEGKIVSTVWYAGTDTPCLYFVYEAGN